jgi:hypothetical protein
MIQIRGSPATGKTTLTRLLEHHIATVSPSYKVYSLSGYYHPHSASQNEAISPSYQKTLEALTGMALPEMMNDSKLVLVWDEAQDSYWAVDLWRDFFKALGPGNGPIVFAFCSYGATGREPDEGSSAPIALGERTPINLRPSQKFELLPESDLRSIRLTPDEASVIVLKRLQQIPDPAKFSLEAIWYLWDICDGHVGALVDVLDFVMRVYNLI